MRYKNNKEIMETYHISIWPEISKQDQELLNITHNGTKTKGH